MVFLTIEQAPHRAGFRPHQDGFCLQIVAIAVGALDHGSIGDAGRGKDDIFGDQVMQAIDPVQILDPGLLCPSAFVIVAEQKPSVDLSAHAFQRCSGKHAFRCATGAHIHVDPGFRAFGAMDHASDVAIRDQADRGAGFPHFGDQVLVAGAFEDTDRHIGRFAALGLGKALDPLAVEDLLAGLLECVDRRLDIGLLDGEGQLVLNGAAKFLLLAWSLVLLSHKNIIIHGLCEETI